MLDMLNLDWLTYDLLHADDWSMLVDAGADMVDAFDVFAILHPTELHQVCNTVRQYEKPARKAAWIAYSRRYVEARITAERVAAYNAIVRRPHFGPVLVTSPMQEKANKKPLTPEDIRLLVETLKGKAYSRSQA